MHSTLRSPLQSLRMSHQSRALRLLGQPEARPGLGPVAYDTGWLASLPSLQEPSQPLFPECLSWLLDHQLADGSWGGSIAFAQDRILCTLAAIVALARFNHADRYRRAIEAGRRYIWKHWQDLAAEQPELVGFEVLLPALVERASDAGIEVPAELRPYAERRARKLQLIPSGALYSANVSLVHSLEFLGNDADLSRLKGAQGADGCVGNSPAATAFLYDRTADGKALRYLRHVAQLSRDGGITVAYPCETFEYLWSAYHLLLGGIAAQRLMLPDEQASLEAALAKGGVGFSASFTVPDADDTAVALILLAAVGRPVDAATLAPFALGDGGFVSYPHERHASASANLHVLHALLRVPGYRHTARTVDRLLEVIIDARQSRPFWLDKWHISPYYTTAHALQVFSELSPRRAERLAPIVDCTRDWLRQTQSADGSWGFFGQATREETAYAMLALASGQPDAADVPRCAAGAKFLRATEGQPHPPLWIEKCLYAPALVVDSAIEAALLLDAKLQRRPSCHGDTTVGSREPAAA